MYALHLVLALIALYSGSSQTFAQGQDPFIPDPDPARFAAAIARFLATDATVPPPRRAIVCTGSSSMRMWHPRIQNDLPGLTLLTRGFGGSHYSDVIHYVEALILNNQPRAVLLYEGDNDAAHGKSPERIFQDFERLVNRCRKVLPELRFYIIGAKPSMARWGIADSMQAANARIEAYCRAHAGFTYIDVWPVLLGANGEPRRELFMADQLHLNAAGYDEWARVIAPVLQAGEAEFE